MHLVELPKKYLRYLKRGGEIENNSYKLFFSAGMRGKILKTTRLEDLYGLYQLSKAMFPGIYNLKPPDRLYITLP